MIGSIFGQNCGNFFTNEMDCIKMHLYICPDVHNFHINLSLFCSNFLCLKVFLVYGVDFHSVSERKKIILVKPCQRLVMLVETCYEHNVYVWWRSSVSVSSVTGHNKAISYCKRHRDWAIHPHWDYSLHWTCTFHLLPDPPMRNPSGRGLLFCVWC